MTLSALGIFSAAGAGGLVAGPSYELISSTILTGTQATVTFSSLDTYASTYKHLEIRWTARTNRGTDAADILEMLVNSNAATKTHMLYGDAGSVGSQADTFGFKAIATTAAPAFPTDGFGAGVITILDAYSSTKNKTVRSLSALPQVGGAFRWVSLASAFYGTEAVSSITLDVIASFIAGSRFSIYGIKG